MRKKSFLSIVAVVVLLGLTLTSYEGHALSEYERLQNEIKKVQQEQARLVREKAEAERNQEILAGQIQAAEQDLNRIHSDIEANSLAMLALQVDIADQQNKLFDAAEELEAVKKRIEERDELIRERLRMMYKKGDVDYVEVLMQSTDFSDFLDRMHYLNLVVNQDQVILDQQKADKVVKEQKHEEIALGLAKLEDMYAEKEAYELRLIDLKREREVQIASMEQQVEELEHISEEAERLVIELAAKEAALNKEISSLRFSAGKLAYPLPRAYTRTSNFGYRTDPITGARGAFHSGIDIAAPGGTDILASADGIVIAAQWVNGYGNYVIIDHGTGDKGKTIWTLYAHMSKITASNGDHVKAGDKIGEVGSTGRSTGNHLHFEVRENQVAVDPDPYLN